MSTPIKFILCILSLYCIYCGILFFLQRYIIFPVGFTGNPPEPEIRIPGFERIWLNTKSGKTEAWYIPPYSKESVQATPLMIYAHGNAELIDYAYYELLPLTHYGLGILFVEYPGYGRSQGSPSQKSISEVFAKAYDRMISRKDIDPNRIVFCGRSIGSGAICSLAVQKPSSAIILISPFKSVRSFAIRYFFPTFLIRDPFDNLSTVKQYPNPILVFHGQHDNMIPYSHGQTLAKKAIKGRLITYQCFHNDCPPDQSVFINDIYQFLKDAGILY